MFVGDKRDELVEEKKSSESYGSYLNMESEEIYSESVRGMNYTKEDGKKSELNVKESYHYETVWKNDDDNVYYRNCDILKGLKFNATLQVRTELSVLIHHGEIFDGPPSKAPRYGTMAGGIWGPATKSWRELGVNKDDLKESEVWSDIGFIKADEYLPFLIDFRKIVEGESSVLEKIIEIKKLRDKNSLYHKIYIKLKNTYNHFPESFFYMQISVIPGIGEKTAKNIFERGLQTLNEIKSASDEELLSISGVGKGTVQKIRAFFDI